MCHGAGLSQGGSIGDRVQAAGVGAWLGICSGGATNRKRKLSGHLIEKRARVPEIHSGETLAEAGAYVLEQAMRLSGLTFLNL